MSAGIFISFEGIDGAGKSTHIKGLADAFVQAGRSVVRTREPGGTPLAERLRALTLHEEMDGVRVYDPKVLIGILAGFGIIAGILTVLYPLPIVRYVFCIAILVAVWMKRSMLLSLWKQLREGGKKRKK